MLEKSERESNNCHGLMLKVHKNVAEPGRPQQGKDQPHMRYGRLCLSLSPAGEIDTAIAVWNPRRESVD